MKTLKIFLVICLPFFVISCQSPVVFTEPQPSGRPELTGIPQEYQGFYWCDTDSITLTIEENVIIKQKDFEVKLSVTEIDSGYPNLSFNDKKLYSKELNDSFPTKQVGDTIIAQVTIRDTLFSTKTKQVLKFYKGHLILNEPIENYLWEVSVISFTDHDILSITKAEIPDELDKLEQVTKVHKTKIDKNLKPIQIRIAPTQAEFAQILRKKLLFTGSCIEFKRIFPMSDIPL